MAYATTTNLPWVARVGVVVVLSMATRGTKGTGFCWRSQVLAGGRDFFCLTQHIVTTSIVGSLFEICAATYVINHGPII